MILGIVTAGKTYYDIMEAFDSLGWTHECLNKIGIRVLKLGLAYHEPIMIDKFSEGLNELFVIEEKRSFIEMQLKEQMYNKAKNQ